MIHAADEFGRNMQQEFGTAFRTGVGLHYGLAITGMVGHPARPQFTAIGDTVNVACRIESQNKRLGTRFLASPEVVQQLEGELNCQPHSAPGGLLFEITDFTPPDRLLLVQTSAARALAEPERFAAAFYDRLFTLAPPTRALFTGDLAAQGRMFVQMIQTTVAGLSRLDDLKLGLIEMGRRHAGYHVRDEHYTLAKEAFLHTLQALLGSSITPEVLQAWSEVFDTLAAVMQRGARAESAAKVSQV
jgi:hemoglobin-like flavoprotein